MGSCYPNDVIKIALGEVGYEEGPNNWTKYAEDLDSINYFNGNKQNVAWCGTFDYWCILMACLPSDRSLSEKKWDGLYFTYQPSSDNCACACRYGAQYFRDAGAFYSSPKVGDIAFYGSAGSETHQGIVYTVDGDSFQAIEGNHNNKVDIVSRNVSECSGFGRPRYDEGPSPSPTPPSPTPSRYTVQTNSGDALRLREEPNTSSSQVGWIDNGTTFTADKVVSGESIGGITAWVYYNGGYASGKYLVPTPVVPDVEPEPTPEPSLTPGTYTVKANDFLAIRTGPGTGNKKVGELYSGAVVTVTEISGTWGKISGNCWVSMNYLK